MRIVSLLASGTEIVCGLGAGKDLVGRSHECDNPDWIKRLPVCTWPAFDVEMCGHTARRGQRWLPGFDSPGFGAERGNGARHL